MRENGGGDMVRKEKVCDEEGDDRGEGLVLKSLC